MEAIQQWWGGLSAVNQGFYLAAVFFSAFFVWQLIGMVLGVSHGGAGEFDSHVEPAAAHETPQDAASDVAFKLVSVRSVLAFFTLFFWSGAMYLNTGVQLLTSLLYALLWGLLAMFVISIIVTLLRKLSETGNIRVDTCVGTAGTVYLDIPPGGQGEVRVTCDGILTHLRASGAAGEAIKAGTPIRVIRQTGPNSIEVEVDGKDGKA